MEPSSSHHHEDHHGHGEHEHGPELTPLGYVIAWSATVLLPCALLVAAIRALLLREYLPAVAAACGAIAIAVLFLFSTLRKWWRRYIFSTDHKVIGIQYGLSGLSFLFFGFCLMMMM